MLISANITSAKYMKNSKVCSLSASVIMTVTLLAAQQAGQPVAPPTAADQQRASIAAMADSLSRQRASIGKQIGGSQPDGFFVLPPPQHLSAPGHPAACPPLSEPEVSSLVENAANREGVDPLLVRSVMGQESSFRPCAVSPKGAQGLMQLMPETASQLGVVNPFDPSSNVEAGAKLLKTLLNRYNGNLMLALGAYNAGPDKVDSANGIPQIPETLNYVNRILGALANSGSLSGNGRSGVDGP